MCRPSPTTSRHLARLGAAVAIEPLSPKRGGSIDHRISDLPTSRAEWAAPRIGRRRWCRRRQRDMHTLRSESCPSNSGPQLGFRRCINRPIDVAGRPRAQSWYGEANSDRRSRVALDSTRLTGAQHASNRQYIAFDGRDQEQKNRRAAGLRRLATHGHGYAPDVTPTWNASHSRLVSGRTFDVGSQRDNSKPCRRLTREQLRLLFWSTALLVPVASRRQHCCLTGFIKRHTAFGVIPDGSKRRTSSEAH